MERAKEIVPWPGGIEKIKHTTHKEKTFLTTQLVKRVCFSQVTRVYVLCIYIYVYVPHSYSFSSSTYLRIEILQGRRR